MAITVPRDPEAWAKLGARIREHREEAGYSRRVLAEKAGVSEKSIQVAEEGRVPRGRMPQSLSRIERALGWPPGAYLSVLLGKPLVRTSGREVEAEIEPPNASDRIDVPVPDAAAAFRLIDARVVEATQSGHLAQDTFIRQMKRYRRMQNVSREELAKRLAARGVGIDLAALTRLEDGTRLLKMSEADLLAEALGTDVQWLLGSGFSGDAPEEMTAPPTDEELQAEAKAIERRMLEMGSQVNSASQSFTAARQREAAARENAEMAMAYLRQVTAQQAELERQYHYLIGRIDSLRAAKGEEQIIQVHPVYEDEG
ncbi:helix-turn-helix domain-containing protein [Streptomyces sp. JH14]|uniref:helix-turn-helix transcriptional regulator n=1 Tax=Streptomyces sp. JH14 TaxID=2793630 RepID=UPI0023F7B4DE|nr:helix-turn-helix transcriptional regulator [Streptomyces sp. JH14]MDF6043214.1 helix-turn-helix domain-containing protein [Streptomyces sp. JH14]